jgi:hypothetical protein
MPRKNGHGIAEPATRKRKPPERASIASSRDAP